MPVQLLKNINPTLTISVWHIAEEIDELRSDININKQEEQELELIHHTRGKKQWLAARKVALIGVEPPSVADVNNMRELTEVHQTLFRGNECLR